MGKNIREHIRNRDREKYHNDINYTLSEKLRNRLRQALLRQLTSKNDTTEALLGVNYSEFKNYIEYLMTPDMKWNNIELDHVRPLSSIDLSDIEQLKEAGHYSNIQPMLSKHNRSKSDCVHEYDLWLQSENLYNYEKYKY